MERGLDEFIKYMDLIRQSIDNADAIINLKGSFVLKDNSVYVANFWYENLIKIESAREKSKLELTHIMVVDRNEEAIKFAINKKEDLFLRYDIFRTDNKGFIDDWKGSAPLPFIDDHFFDHLDIEIEMYNLWFNDASGIKPYNDTGEEIAQAEKHTNIFKRNGFILFDYLMNNCNTKSKKTDVGFFYQKMEDEYLKVGKAEFRRWIKSVYNIDIAKIKTDLDTMETYYKARQDNFNRGLEWFKTQSIQRNKTGTKVE